MNSKGRHYRGQADTTNPECDYDGCTFFTSGQEFSDLPYPNDVSLGPVSLDTSAEPASDNVQLARILQLLEEQKSQSERQQGELRSLQQQMSALSGTAPLVQPVSMPRPAPVPTPTLPPALGTPNSRQSLAPNVSVPVSLFRAYLNRTSDFKKGRLFRSASRISKELTKKQLSTEICKLIVRADPDTKANVHDIRINIQSGIPT